MKSLILILLLTIGGSMGMEFFNNCNLNKCSHMVPREIVENFKIPTAEELKEICPSLSQAMDCYLKEVVDCTGQTLEELADDDDEMISKAPRLYKNVMEIIDDICDEHSRLHKKYVARAPCLKGMVQTLDASCAMRADRLYELYNLHLMELSEDGTFDESPSETCMTKAYDMACSVKKIKKGCGVVAGNMVMEVLKRIQFLKQGFCTEEEILTLKTKFVDFLVEHGHRRRFLVSAFDFRRKK